MPSGATPETVNGAIVGPATTDAGRKEGHDQKITPTHLNHMATILFYALFRIDKLTACSKTKVAVQSNVFLSQNNICCKGYGCCSCCSLFFPQLLYD